MDLKNRVFLTKKWMVVAGRCTAVIKLDRPNSMPMTVKVIQDHPTPIRLQSTCTYMTVEDWRNLVRETEEAIATIEGLGVD